MAAARALIRDVISDTPVLHSRVLSETVAGPVFLKCENLQRTGSFKVRGAYSRIARLSDAERARGVVAASAGNHAQGVAFAAGRLGCAATVVMPAGAPLRSLVKLLLGLPSRMHRFPVLPARPRALASPSGLRAPPAAAPA